MLPRSNDRNNNGQSDASGLTPSNVPQAASIGSAFNPGAHSNNNNAAYLQQMMLSHHPGTQNQLMYQNSILGASNMMNQLQMLPTVTSNNAAAAAAAAAAVTAASTETNPMKLLNSNNPLNLPNVAAAAAASSLLSTTTTGNNHPASAAAAFPPGTSITSMTLGGVKIPPVPANASTAQQVQIAAAAAAAEAAPPKGYHGPVRGTTRSRDNNSQQTENNEVGKPPAKRGKRNNSASAELTEEERKQLNRDRNRQHARSTRLRKKAYVNKLKELVDGLHAERSEEARKRRVAVQHLAEVQNTRRKVVSKFLRFHSTYENDSRKWNMLLEDDFYLKQPLTPFRSFRTKEIDQTNDKVCTLLVSGDILLLLSIK